MSAAPFDLAALEAYLQKRHAAPVTVEELRQLGGDDQGADALKQFGYGNPLLVTYRLAGAPGEPPRQEVIHNIRRTPFGRERDDDRVAAVWLDYQTFNKLPRHVPAVDRVGLSNEGQLHSLRHLQDLLLVTTYRPGAVYAEDLLSLRDGRPLAPRDLDRAADLARYLAGIHSRPYRDHEDRQAVVRPKAELPSRASPGQMPDNDKRAAVRSETELPSGATGAALWNRRLRDLVGHGEGIMGLADSYPLPLPYVDDHDLRRIEVLANDWRWRLKPLHHRLCQVHGDFHPFNVIFDEQGQFHVLDRSRGAWGEAADDVSCLTINYLFFSLQQSGRPLAPPFSHLYRRFWETYLHHRPDDALQDVIAPWFAWRALVVASPVWYPNVAHDVRRKLLTFARRVMLAARFDWQNVAQYMRGSS